MKCTICKTELGERPNNILLQHRAEGIQLNAICQNSDCWEKLGKKMIEGKR